VAVHGTLQAEIVSEVGLDFFFDDDVFDVLPDGIIGSTCSVYGTMT